MAILKVKDWKQSRRQRQYDIITYPGFRAYPSAKRLADGQMFEIGQSVTYCGHTLYIQSWRVNCVHVSLIAENAEISDIPVFVQINHISPIT